MQSVDAGSTVVLGNPYENPHPILRPRTLSTEYLSDFAETRNIRLVEVTGAVNTYQEVTDCYIIIGYAFWPMFTQSQMQNRTVANPVSSWTMYNHAGRWDRDCLVYMLDKFEILRSGEWSHYEASTGPWPGVVPCLVKEVQDRAGQLAGQGNSGINRQGHPGRLNDWQDRVCFDIDLHSRGAACVMTETQTLDSWFVTEKLWRTFMLKRIPLVMISEELHTWLTDQGFWLPVSMKGNTYDKARQIADWINSNSPMAAWHDYSDRLEENLALASSRCVMRNLQQGMIKLNKRWDLPK